MFKVKKNNKQTLQHLNTKNKQKLKKVLDENLKLGLD